jgi:hypothetical protein
VEDDARALSRLAPGLRGDSVRLARLGHARPQGAALEHGGGITEDGIHGVVDVAVTVELAVGVRVQRVLVPGTPQRWTTARSALTRSATACPLFGPARFSTVMSRIMNMNPAPDAAARMKMMSYYPREM